MTEVAVAPPTSTSTEATPVAPPPPIQLTQTEQEVSSVQPPVSGEAVVPSQTAESEANASVDPKILMMQRGLEPTGLHDPALTYEIGANPLPGAQPAEQKPPLVDAYGELISAGGDSPVVDSTPVPQREAPPSPLNSIPPVPAENAQIPYQPVEGTYVQTQNSPEPPPSHIQEQTFINRPDGSRELRVTYKSGNWEWKDGKWVEPGPGWIDRMKKRAEDLWNTQFGNGQLKQTVKEVIDKAVAAGQITLITMVPSLDKIELPQVPPSEASQVGPTIQIDQMPSAKFDVPMPQAPVEQPQPVISDKPAWETAGVPDPNSPAATGVVSDNPAWSGSGSSETVQKFTRELQGGNSLEGDFQYQVLRFEHPDIIEAEKTAGTERLPSDHPLVIQYLPALRANPAYKPSLDRFYTSVVDRDKITEGDFNHDRLKPDVTGYATTDLPANIYAQESAKIAQSGGTQTGPGV